MNVEVQTLLYKSNFGSLPIIVFCLQARLHEKDHHDTKTKQKPDNTRNNNYVLHAGE